MALNVKRNVITRPYTFYLIFADGHAEERTVQAESYHAAILALPPFSQAGRYKYTQIGGERE